MSSSFNEPRDIPEKYAALGRPTKNVNLASEPPIHTLRH